YFFEQPLPVLLLDAHFLGLLLTRGLFLRAQAKEAGGVRGTLLVGANVQLATGLRAFDHDGGGGGRTFARALRLVVVGWVQDARLDLLAVQRIRVRYFDRLLARRLQFLEVRLDQGADFAAKTLAVGADILPW